MALLETVFGYGTDANKPANPAEGWLYYSTDTTDLERYDGSAWQTVATHSNIDGSNLAETAEDDTTPGLMAVFPVAIAGGPQGDTDITVDGKWRVIDAWAVHTAAGEANDTIQIKNAGNAITDAMDWSGADQVIVRASSINDANHEIADGGTLRVTTTDDDAGNDVGAGIVYVTAMHVA